MLHTATGFAKTHAATYSDARRAQPRPAPVPDFVQPPQPPQVLYDDQAARFDERAGLPAHAAESIAAALAEIVGIAPGQRWLEVGAGTGSLSLPLLRRAIRYRGFDRSPAMLDVFRQRAAEAGLHPELIVADGNGPWPVGDVAVDVVFAARALHHVDTAHAVAEARRVLAHGGWLAVGRVRRPQDSPRSVLRRRMRQLLRDEGYAGRSGERHAEAVFDALEAAGATRHPPREAARWTTVHSPADSLASWREKAGLAGLELPTEAKERVLHALAEWALAEFGDVHRPLPQDESFEIYAIRI
jgi:ubiquinone/menaquinone biosynthesis C-methylase UbiE